MPALSPTMTEGTLARWLKKEGEQIRAGDVIAEIETDKATMEVEAVDEGVLSKILVADGTAGVKVNDPIAVLQGEGEESSAPAAAPPAAVQAPPAATPSAPAAAPAVASAPAQQAVAQPGAQPGAQPMANGHDAHRVFASPLARRMAKQAGIDLSTMRGTGPNGRIVRADIEAKQSTAPPASAERVEAQAGSRESDAPQQAPVQQVKPAAPAVAPPQPAPVAAAPMPAAKPAPITAPHQLVPNNTMRKVIARRLLESHQQVPNFYVTMDIEIDALLKLRADLNARAPKEGKGAFKLSVNDLVIKAAAVALRRVPKMNASYTEDATVVYDDVDISVAVSMPDGLITPIVRRADQKGLAAISAEMKDLGARAKSGKLKPEEFQGGSFSISNLGMFGVKRFTAIINPPQAGILAVGAGEQRPVVRNGALAIASVMTCTLSVDHRVADGALGAEWMQVFRGIVEDPLSLML